MQYHHTDQLGHAVTGARSAAKEALEQLTALDEELAAERESHRAEVTRLVKRAEAAELERDRLRHIGVSGGALELARKLEATKLEAEAEAARWRAELEKAQAKATEERDARRDAEDRADDAERAQTLAEERVRDLEDQVVGYQQSLAERNADLAELKAAAEAVLAHVAPWELPGHLAGAVSELVRLARQ